MDSGSSDQIAIGIDLGTTNSCIGVWQKGKVEIINNFEGKSTTPSYVAFCKDHHLVGQGAVNQAHRNAENTVNNAKRLIGMKYTDFQVQEDMKHWGFKVEQGAGDKPLIKVKYQNQDKYYHAEQISAFILSKMKEIAEKYLNDDYPNNISKKVTQAVITVPAYFNDSQRQATADAAKIAGLNVQRIINEPNAAAIAYGIAEKVEGQKNVLIFDLGGGTFDVSILQMEEGVFEVKATCGDTHLGGEDFDNRLVQHCVGEFKNQTGEEIEGKKGPIRRLKTQVEKIKKLLSSMTEAMIECDMLYNSEDFSLKITRAKFEDLCDDLFKKCIPPVEQVLKDSGLNKNQVDEVVLVGGSTYIPKVQQMVKDFFGGKELNKSINPDVAVAYGATVQAAVLNGQAEDECTDILLLDVTPLSQGVEVAGGQMQVMIERNSNIPMKKSKIFSTAKDNQKEVKIKIFEGERALTKDCHALGVFTLQVPPAPARVPQIEVIFDLDSNGILNVHATNKAEGMSKGITVVNDKGRLAGDEINQMLADAEKFRTEDQAIRMRVENEQKLKYCAKNMLSFVENPQYANRVSNQQKTDIVSMAQQALTWLNSNKDADVAAIQHQQQQLDGYFIPLMQKLGGIPQAPSDFNQQPSQPPLVSQQSFNADSEAPQTNPGPQEQQYMGYPNFLD